MTVLEYGDSAFIGMTDITHKTNKMKAEYAVNRALVVGDMHGNTGAWVFKVFPAAQKAGADIIIQVGDFGFWHENEKYVRKVAKYATRWNIPVAFLDGNHEQHDRLDKNGWKTATEPVEILPNLLYLPRGCRWSWWDVKCMAMGGAYSIDEGYRKRGHDWFPQEQVSQADVDRALAPNAPIDILFCHDVPSGIKVPGLHADAHDMYPQSRITRDYLREIVDETAPKLLIHGHHHVAYYVDGNPQIVGLTLEGERGSMISLDFPTREWRLEL